MAYLYEWTFFRLKVICIFFPSALYNQILCILVWVIAFLFIIAFWELIIYIQEINLVRIFVVDLSLSPTLPFFLILTMVLFCLGAIYFSFITAGFYVIIWLFLKAEIRLSNYFSLLWVSHKRTLKCLRSEEYWCNACLWISPISYFCYPHWSYYTECFIFFLIFRNII